MLELKEIIYIFIYVIVYIVSLISVFLAMKYKQSNLEERLTQMQSGHREEMGQIRKILFGKRGSLNLVDVETCKNNRDQVYAAIRRGEQVQEMLLKRVEELNKNVLIIMVHLNVRSPNSTAMEEICKAEDGLKTGRKSAWDTKIQPRLKEIAAWCRDGAIDKEIAKRLGISHETLYKYLRLKPELVDALRINKEIADLEIENALYKRAQGYELIETSTKIVYDGNGNEIKRTEEKTTKTIIPDTTAQIFWLKNRQIKKWANSKQIEISGEVNLNHDNWVKKMEQIERDRETERKTKK